jgi:hypothetical protein
VARLWGNRVNALRDRKAEKQERNDKDWSCLFWLND